MLTYSKVTKDDFGATVDLYEKYLNAGEGIREYLRKSFMLENYVGYKCCDDGRMIGIFSARPGVYFTYEHAELEAMIRRRWPKDIYSGDMLVVEEAYCGQGIAHRLTRGCCDLVKEAGGKHLLVELWLKPDGEEPAGGIVKDMGTGIFEAKWTIPDFYKDMHLYGMTCPRCGARCVCGAIVGVVQL